jgi:hypothetical protein
MIMRHLKYLKYVLRHKWFVMVECFRHGLYYRGIKHDISKFFPSEWIPYTNFFYGKSGSSIKSKRDSTGYYKPTDTGDKAFDFAWFIHQKRNDHHWQWWVLLEDGGGFKILEMSVNAVFEMLCDWCGASKAQGHGGWEGVFAWYEANAHKMRLHPASRDLVESILKNKGWKNGES